MERSGLVDIQSHAMTHTWYFNGPRIVSFHAPHPITPYPWLFWNSRPDRKPFYLVEDQQEFIPWGTPILEHGKSLETRRFFPDAQAMQEFVHFVATEGGREFFKRTDWKGELERLRDARFDGGSIPGVYETDEMRHARLTEELANSKALIERNLGKQVDFICWPGGAHGEAVQKIARQVGFKSWTLGSRSQVQKRNLPGTDPTTIKRIGTSNRIDVRGRDCGMARGPRLQMWNVLAHQGSRVHSLGTKAYKLGALISDFGGTRQ
jgi:hypothetical protein